MGKWLLILLVLGPLFVSETSKAWNPYSFCKDRLSGKIPEEIIDIDLYKSEKERLHLGQAPDFDSFESKLAYVAVLFEPLAFSKAFDEAVVNGKRSQKLEIRKLVSDVFDQRDPAATLDRFISNLYDVTRPLPNLKGLPQTTALVDSYTSHLVERDTIRGLFLRKLSERGQVRLADPIEEYQERCRGLWDKCALGTIVAVNLVINHFGIVPPGMYFTLSLKNAVQGNRQQSSRSRARKLIGLHFLDKATKLVVAASLTWAAFNVVEKPVVTSYQHYQRDRDLTVEQKKGKQRVEQLLSWMESYEDQRGTSFDPRLYKMASKIDEGPNEGVPAELDLDWKKIQQEWAILNR